MIIKMTTICSKVAHHYGGREGWGGVSVKNHDNQGSDIILFTGLIRKRWKCCLKALFNDPLITDVYGLIFLLDFGVIDISHYILRHWICPCCFVLVFVYSSSLNVQEYMVTISNKIIEDAVKAVREDCSMENIKWVDNIFYWFTWCEFECWFFRRLAETIKKYRPESMEVKNVRKLWSFQKW